MITRASVESKEELYGRLIVLVLTVTVLLSLAGLYCFFVEITGIFTPLMKLLQKHVSSEFDNNDMALISVFLLFGGIFCFWISEQLDWRREQWTGKFWRLMREPCAVATFNLTDDQKVMSLAYLEDKFDYQYGEKELRRGLHVPEKLEYYADPDCVLTLNIVQIQSKKTFSETSTFAEKLPNNNQATRLIGTANLSSLGVENKDLSNKYHTSQLPTISLFGHKKTSMIGFSIQKNQEHDGAVTFSFYDNTLADLEIMDRNRSVNINLGLPDRYFDQILSALDANEIEKLTFHLRGHVNGLFSNLKYCHHKLLLKKQEVCKKSPLFDSIMHSDELKTDEYRFVPKYDNEVIANKYGNFGQKIVTMELYKKVKIIES